MTAPTVSRRTTTDPSGTSAVNPSGTPATDASAEGTRAADPAGLRTNRRQPQLVDSGPRTANVLRFHQAAPNPAPAAPAGSRPRTHGSSALAPEPAPRPARHLHAVPTPAQTEEVRKLAAAITRAAMEVLAGTRPVAQLAPWLRRDLIELVQLRADLGRAAGAGAGAGTSGRSGGNPPKAALVHRAAVVTSAHASLVEPGVYEAAVVVSDAARCRAVALRLESVGLSWQVTALEIG